MARILENAEAIRTTKLCTDNPNLSMSEEPFGKTTEQECSMCGDVGFLTELFRCTKCLKRFQHTYCSRGYPYINLSRELTCDWCCDEEGRNADNKLKPKKKLSSTEVDWHRYKNALHFLLEVAQEAAEREYGTDEKVKKNVFCNKATTSNRPESKRHCGTRVNKNRQRRPEQWNYVIRKKLRLPVPSKGIGRRYKLLSDVLC